MNFIKIQYTGRKPYRDATKLRNVWAPGDAKLVPELDAKMLLRFAEFQPAEAKQQADPAAKQEDAEVQQAKAAQEAAEAEAKQQADLLAGVLAEIESMDKAALEAYAKRYEVELDKRKAVGTLRIEVQNLVEAHGVI
ncbi:hypothetical protein D8I35_05350 [Corticibacter populi]|uniref:Uncharacterized protein n=1 Tax=Corticibacter populi TaxID=1550736 RepID=A0A3M6QZQ3_9BURK|nr:hypothetical protein [Corticibacter populi]RMX08504.1 hypothetical protein D8I35_05350 [Corticibacter populi]RZS35816.1 hypothetical protein EV687_0895 [Corticibacter populi]